MKIKCGFCCVVNSVIGDETVRSACLYRDSKSTIKVTRRFKPDKRRKSNDYVLTIGSPNFNEKKFIKKHVSIGGTFPKLTTKKYKA